MTKNITVSEIPDPEIILARIDKEINLLSKTKSTILNEKLGLPPIIALVIALFLNILGMSTQTTTYMAIWISSSLYFYIFYPMLPILLFPFTYLKKKKQGDDEKKNKESPVKWVKKIQILKHKRIGFRLFMRFFILSLLPLTIGMIFIYLISIIFSIYLGSTNFIPFDTTELILVQCVGIILFYIEIFFFRHQLFRFTEYILKQRAQERKRIILLGVLGIIFLLVGTVVIFILLIAILLPGYTLTNYINVFEFIKVRSNIWIILILISQIIIMQYLQHILSLKIVLSSIDDLLKRHIDAKSQLISEKDKYSVNYGADDLQESKNLVKEPLKVLRETALYSFNRKQLFGLFPTYSIGINISNLLNINSLAELKDIFFKDEE